MSKFRLGIVIALVGALAAFGAGCGGDTTSSTPAGTESTSTPKAAGAGDVANGKTLFEGKCQGCHAKDGTEAAVGPKLSGGGRTSDRIRDQIVNGGGVMPPGLYSGTDLDDVVAFVLSIQ